MPSPASSSRRKILSLVIAVSIGIHVLALLAFGAFKIVQTTVREEQVFEVPPPAAQEEPPAPPPDIEQRSRSSAPPRPNPITVDAPDIALPALDIDLNVESSSAYGRGSGGFGTGDASLREMAIDMENFEFFGREVKGGTERVLFLLDISGSMVLEDRGRDGYRAVVDEVVKTLESMQEQQTASFNIIAFAGESLTFRGNFASINPERIEDAREWMLKYDPGIELDKARESGKKLKFGPRHQGTRVDLALRKAFGKNPRSIILLSDGEPTKLLHQDIFKIVDDLQPEDEPVPINTVSYRSDQGRWFLRTLAERHEGEYQQVE